MFGDLLHMQTSVRVLLVRSNESVYLKDLLFDSLMAQIVTSQPGTTVVVQQTQVLRDWNSGVFSCLDDIGSCLMGWCCPCIQLCNISSRMGEGFLYGCCCSEIAPFTLRAKLRTEQHIQGSLCNDALLVMFCPSCVMCQMDRELKAVGR